MDWQDGLRDFKGGITFLKVSKTYFNVYVLLFDLKLKYFAVQVYECNFLPLKFFRVQLH